MLLGEKMSHLKQPGKGKMTWRQFEELARREGFTTLWLELNSLADNEFPDVAKTERTRSHWYESDEFWNCIDAAIRGFLEERRDRQPLN